MPRKRMVTRTVDGTMCEFIALNKDDNNTYTDTRMVYGTYLTTEKLLKALKKGYDTSERVALYLTKYVPCTKRFGMTETKFIEDAEELPLLPSGSTEEE